MKSECAKGIVVIIILTTLIVAGILGTIKQNKISKSLMEFTSTKGEK